MLTNTIQSKNVKIMIILDYMVADMLSNKAYACLYYTILISCTKKH